MKALIKTTLILTALFSATAQATCADDDEICWRQEATAQWRAEYGDAPPPLTQEGEKEIRAWLAKHYPNTDFDNP